MKVTPAGLNALANNDLENFIVASTPGGIEAQEARGQKIFVNNTTLPKEMLHGCTKEKLEALGIIFKEDHDNLFINVDLPKGWTKQATSHSMWSDLLDDKGRKRASIFYKAAFYDRSAHISLNRRFSAAYNSEDQYKSDMSYNERKNGNWYGFVYDCDKIIHKIGPVKAASYEQRNELEKKAINWLKNKYPDYENELAYWD